MTTRMIITSSTTSMTKNEVTILVKLKVKSKVTHIETVETALQEIRHGTSLLCLEHALVDIVSDRA